MVDESSPQTGRRSNSSLFPDSLAVSAQDGPTAVTTNGGEWTEFVGIGSNLLGHTWYLDHLCPVSRLEIVFRLFLRSTLGHILVGIKALPIIPPRCRGNDAGMSLRDFQQHVIPHAKFI